VGALTRSACAKASADAVTLLIRRSFSEGGRARCAARVDLPTRGRWTILVFVALLALAACAPARGPVTDIAGAMPRLEFAMTRANDGKDVTADAYRGHVVILYFGYTNCPDLCPLTMSNTAVALRMLPAADRAKIRVLFVSVDPGRDTLARLKSWLGNFDPAFIGLRGTLAQVQSFEQQTGLPIGPEFKDSKGEFQLDHATEMFAYSTDNVAHEAFFPSTPPTDMANDLKLLVAGGKPSS